jgi:hypothetical protein
MPTNRTDARVDDDPRDEGDDPSVRQLLHAATGDRDAEAAALADRAGEDVSEEAAKLAVRRAEGDVHGEPTPDHDIATPEDAKQARDEG